MTTETIKDYVTSDIGASQSLVTLEGFIGDVENAETVDDGTFDCSDAVTAINGLIFALEQRDAKIARMEAALRPFALHFDRNDCETRGDDDALEVPIGDLRRATDALEQTTETAK